MLPVLFGSGLYYLVCRTDLGSHNSPVMEGDTMFKFLLRKLREETGTASVSSSAFYDNFVTNKYPPAATDIGGRVVPVSVTHTINTGTFSTGTVETVSGTVTLFTHRKGWKFIALFCSAGATTNTAVLIGDGTTANKYMLASDLSAANGVGLVNGGSYGYTPTTDVPVTLTWGATGTPAPGVTLTVTMLFIPGS